MDENPLSRAHTLSAEASLLLKPSNATPANLDRALAAYEEAAGLFEQAVTTGQKGDDERRTLSLLVTQHKKLVRDVERRISIGKRAAALQTAAQALPEASETIPRRPGEGKRKDSVGLASAAAIGSRSSAGLGVPPFALRPSGHPPFARSVTTPQLGAASLVPGPNLPHSQGGAGSHDFSLSPLHSSSSSDESYLNLGVLPDTLDPFSRFWGMLENMLDDISNPVAFASVPLTVEEMDGFGGVKKSERVRGKDRIRGIKRDKLSSKAHQRDTSSESFYMVNRDQCDSDSQKKIGESSRGAHGASTHTVEKTPEELALDNEHLRASLNALALHAEEVEKENHALREQHEEREKMMKSVVTGMRVEAQKVKQGQDLMRSQLLASVHHSPRAPARPPGDSPGQGDHPGLRAKIRGLEEEVKTLKEDNEKQRAHAEKYRDKLHQIKAAAKAKKEARAANGTSVASASVRSGSSRRALDRELEEA